MVRIIMSALLLLLPVGLMVAMAGEGNPLLRDVSPTQAIAYCRARGYRATGLQTLPGSDTVSPPGTCRNRMSPNRSTMAPTSSSGPANAWPKVPPGFKVEEFLTGLDNPRLIRTAPNGDIFVAESRPGRIRVLRAADGAAHPEVNQVFVSGLDRPFGIAFYPPGPTRNTSTSATRGPSFDSPTAPVSSRPAARRILLFLTFQAEVAPRRRTLDTRYRFFREGRRCLSRSARIPTSSRIQTRTRIGGRISCSTIPTERDSGSMHPGYATPSVSRSTRRPGALGLGQ